MPNSVESKAIGVGPTYPPPCESELLRIVHLRTEMGVVNGERCSTPVNTCVTPARSWATLLQQLMPTKGQGWRQAAIAQRCDSTLHSPTRHERGIGVAGLHKGL